MEAQSHTNEPEIHLASNYRRRNVATVKGYSFALDGLPLVAVMMRHRSLPTPCYFLAERDDMVAWIKAGFSLRFCFRRQKQSPKLAEVVHSVTLGGEHGRRCYTLARWITNAPAGMTVHYRDGNPLNLRRSNLELKPNLRRTSDPTRTRDRVASEYSRTYPVYSIADCLVAPSEIDLRNLYILR